MIKYKHFAGPSYGGLFVEEQSYYPIRERVKGCKGEVISQDEALDLLVAADLKTKSRFKGVSEAVTIRSK